MKLILRLVVLTFSSQSILRGLLLHICRLLRTANYGTAST
jgi:hypothetical protein